MSDLLVGLLSALVATNPPAALSNLVQQRTGLSLPVAEAAADPFAGKLRQLMEADDAAQAEVDEWIRAGQKERADRPETDEEKVSIRGRILRRFAPVRKGYEDFLEAHPQHAGARLAYGSFLNDIGDEEAAEAQWEKARECDPKNPAAWNNLGNHYGHGGDVRKAFAYYAKAIELEPGESVYYQNLATTVFLFRKDAMDFYHLTEQEVFAKAMDLYRQALARDPENFRLAAEVAQTYYGIKTPKTADAEADARAGRKLAEEALAAWKFAYKLASLDLERESVQLHFCRWQINLGQFEEARRSLAVVTNEALSVSKRTLVRKLDVREATARATNAPAARASRPAQSPAEKP